MDEVCITVHSYDEEPCSSPSLHHGELCAHGQRTHDIWVKADDERVTVEVTC